MTEKVSIITPCYNSAPFIAQTIRSVLAQTYSNWEMIIVDDHSSDGTSEIVHEFCKKDSRIKFYRLEQNTGSATEPRNMGIRLATGRYIAFLDSDDLWEPSKLEEQLPLFQQNNVAIVYANYEKIDEAGVRCNRFVVAPLMRTYRQLLRGNVIGCLTGVFDTKKVGKMYFISVGHEDYVLWLSILKKGFIAVNTNSYLAQYRVRKQSLSSNKIKAFSWVWNIYVRVEKLGYLKSSYYFANYACRAVYKFLK